MPCSGLYRMVVTCSPSLARFIRKDRYIVLPLAGRTFTVRSMVLPRTPVRIVSVESGTFR